MVELKSSLTTQKGIAHLLVIIIVLIGIAAGIILVQNPQIFKPKAYEATRDSSNSEEALQANYADWVTKMQSLGIYPAKEDGEIVLYNKKDFVEKYCQGQTIPGTNVVSTGCYFNAPSIEETLDSVNTNVEFIKELGLKLKETGYAPLTVLKPYFPDIIKIDQSLYLQLEALEPICRQEDEKLVCREGDDEYKREISPEELGKTISQLSLEKHLSEKDAIQRLISITDPIFGTRALINWATLPQHQVTDEDRINAMLGLTVVYGMSEKVALGGIKVTNLTVIKLENLIKEMQAARLTVINGDRIVAWNSFEQAVVKTITNAEKNSFNNKVENIVVKDYINKKKIDPALDITEDKIAGKLKELGYPEQKIPSAAIEIKNRILSNFPGIRNKLALQKEIESAGYLFTTDVVFVPKPVRSNAPVESLFQEWVNAHPEGLARRAAQAIKDNTQHISQAEFEAALEKTVKSANDIIGENDFAVIVDQGRSNQWVAELALPLFRKLPKQIADRQAYINEVARSGINDFVFIDDAIYSGQQMGLNIFEFLEGLKLEGKDLSEVRIIVVTPYSTNYGRRNIQRYSKTYTIVFPQQETIQTIAEKIPDPDILETISKMYPGGNNSRTLTYFDHKIPDSLSTIDAIFVNGLVKDELGNAVTNIDGTIKKIAFVAETVAPYKFTSLNVIHQLEKEMYDNPNIREYMIGQIPNIGQGLSSQIAFLKTEYGDFIALKDPHFLGATLNRSEYFNSLSSKKSLIKLESGDIIEVELDGTSFKLLYDGVRLVLQ